MRVLAETLRPEQVSILKTARRGRYTLTSHAKERMIAKTITRRDIGHCVLTGELIEFNCTGGTRRTLWRDSQGTCIVLDLDTRHIITVFRNGVWDSHDTLDKSAYYWGIVPTHILRGGKL